MEPRTWTLVRAFALYVATLYVITIFGAIADERNEMRPHTTRPLPDVLHDIIPPLSEAYETAPDVIVRIFAVTVAMLVVVSPRRVALATRFLLLHSCILLLRGASTVLTSLPDPSPLCTRHRTPATAAKWLLPILFPVCGDLFFSGHTVCLVMLACTWTRYGSQRPVAHALIAVAAWALAIVGMLALVAARYHYTIDVLYAAIITLLVWRAYDVHVDPA